MPFLFKSGKDTVKVSASKQTLSTNFGFRRPFTYVELEKVRTLIYLGEQEANQGHTQAATTHFERVLELDANNEAALMWLGRLCENPTKAMAYFDIVLKNNPQQTQARYYLEQTLVKVQGVSVVNSIMSKNGVADKRTTVKMPWLGAILVEEGVINQGQLNEALQFQHSLSMKNKWKRLGAILIHLGYINRQQLKHALKVQQERRNSYWQE